VRALYLTMATLHVLCAITWIGGVLFLALVGAPVLRRVEPPSLRRALFEAIGMRFRYVGWGAVAVLLVSGTWLLQLRGWLTWRVLGDGAFWSTGVGSALAWKLALVTAMLLLSAAHDVLLSPARLRALDARPDGGVVRRRLVLLARLGALAALGVVVAAVRLVRG
jgi:copper resistance protein D